MDSIKNVITGTVITLVIGGTAYTFSQEDVIQNFADDTGMTQEQAAQYVNDIPEDELDTFSVIGTEWIDVGQEFLTIANDTDCVNFEYEWESPTLSCTEGKTQLTKLANDTLTMGHAYKKLDSESATKEDMSKTIVLIEQFNDDLDFEIAKALWGLSDLDELNKTNSYNKALIKAALESE
jgi:hypothetical protein